MSRKKSCPNCGGRKLQRVGILIDTDYENVETVHEDHEWKFQKPGPVLTKMSWLTWFKLSLILSLFFTPFLGPAMAYLIKVIYDRKEDKKITKLARKLWANQGFCFKCGIIWEESLDNHELHI